MKNRQTTLKDIADLANVSISTVSRVVNGQATKAARPEVQDRIWAAVKELNYVPNTAAQMLKTSLETKKLRTIACVFSRSLNFQNDPFFSEISRAIETELLRLGYLMKFSVSTQEDPKQTIETLFSNEQVDGVVVLGRTDKRNIELIKKYNKNKKTLESTESTLAYTDNSSMNVGACLSPEDYNTVTAKDDSFSFAYPKYLFNHSEVNEEETSYTFSYKGNSASDSNEAELRVYTQENEGDHLQNARELYQNFSSEVYKKYFKMYPSRVDSSGMARTLIGASADSSEKTGVYIIAANDGKRDYILKFTYPDPDMTNDYNEIDYVVDCVYRFCSFSGGTYQPRSYQQFLDDNMGSKK